MYRVIIIVMLLLFSAATVSAEDCVSCHEKGLSIDGNRDDLLLENSNLITCRQSDEASPQQLPSTLSYVVDSNIWGQIDALAFKTYAPATAESRAGAGAGLTDND